MDFKPPLLFAPEAPIGDDFLALRKKKGGPIVRARRQNEF